MKDDDVLGKGFIPYMSMVFGFLHNDKFTNKNIYKLEGLDVEEMQELLLKEVEEIKALNPTERDNQFQKLFTKIFSFQPTFTSSQKRELKNTEQRIYADIVLTPGFLDDEVVRDFLFNRFQSTDKNSLKSFCLTEIVECLDGLDEESKEKFGYCFRSSSKFARSLLYDDRYFSKLLNDRKLSMFNKETFSQIFRYSDDYNIEAVVSQLLLNTDDRSLFIISQLCEQVYNQVGHTSEFILSVAMMLNGYGSDEFKNILVDYYDKFVGSIENESAFKETLQEGLPYEMRELLNVILDNTYSFSNRIQIAGSDTLDKFMRKVEDHRILNHKNIFGEQGFDKFIDGSFSTDDFKAIISKDDLQMFKDSFLQNIYGISLSQASYFTSRYGHDLDKLTNNILDEDKSTLEVLKSISSISNLSLDNKEGIKLLQEAYFRYMDEKGLGYQKKVNSSVVLEGLFNRMYMNTYRPILYDKLDQHLYIDDGIPVIDAGVDFNLIVTSINGTSKYFENGVNIASKWNTAFRDVGQGLCTSFINNENLGVISLNGPLLGFCNISQDALNTMGVTDIYSYANNFNLRMNYRRNMPFVIGREMANETRYGYNEILIDRFLATDTEGKVKLQPDYLVFYKTQDNYKMSKRYIETLKTAKDFGVPIVIIDYDKVQRHERDTIKDMEDTLFKSDEVDKDLLIGIMSRYMNNISGSRTIHGPTSLGGLGIPKYVDFPEKALGHFIDEVIKKCDVLEDDRQRHEWIEALDMAYENERRKHMNAISTSSYHCSIGNDNDDFNLITDYNLAERLIDLHERYAKEVKEEDASFREGNIPLEVGILTELANTLEFDVSYDVSKVISTHGKKGYSIAKRFSNKDEVGLEEKLVVAYLTDNFKDDILSDMMDNSNNNIKFGTLMELAFKKMNKTPLTERIEGSYLEEEIKTKGIDFNKVNKYISSLEMMEENKFLGIFNNYIYHVSEATAYSHLYIADKFLEKKSCIREEFKKLNDKLVNSNDTDKKIK